jgi:hypothetical protein
MGTPAYSHCIATFDNELAAKVVLPQFVAWSRKANKGKLPAPFDGDYSISEIEQNGDTILFTVDSCRVQNCEFQQDKCLEWFKTKGVLQFQSNVYIMGDGIYYERESD